MKALFKKHDVDSSGSISSGEITEILCELNPSLTASHIKQLLSSGGFNSDQLDYDAFVSWCCEGVSKSDRQKWLEEHKKGSIARAQEGITSNGNKSAIQYVNHIQYALFSI